MTELSLKLELYRCSRCERTPLEEREILKGCVCGNRFFRIILNNSEAKIKSPGSQSNTDDISDIQMVRPGVFEISLESLMEKRKYALILSANEPGKYTIRF